MTFKTTETTIRREEPEYTELPDNIKTREIESLIEKLKVQVIFANENSIRLYNLEERLQGPRVSNPDCGTELPVGGHISALENEIHKLDTISTSTSVILDNLEGII